MDTDKTQRETLILLLFSIYLFNEFEIKDDNIILSLIPNSLGNYDEKLFRDILGRLVLAINTITEMEFYFTFENDLKQISLHCHSNPKFLSLLNIPVK